MSAPASATPAPYHAFSPGRIWTLAMATMTQLVRMRIMGFLLVFCVIVTAAGFAFPVLDVAQQLKLLKDVSFGALQVFSIVIAIVSTALLLPRDLEDRTLYTILSKPVPRHDYLLGKLLGVLLLIGAGLLLMDLMFSVVLWLRQQLVLAEVISALKAEKSDTPQALAQLHELVGKQGLTWTLHAGVFAIFLKASVITALALMISCFSSSTLFTIVITFCMTIVGHGQALMRDYFFHKHLSGTAEAICSKLLAILTPDLGIFDISDNVINGEPVGMQALLYMSGVALLYIVGYAVVSHLLFVEKEL